MHQSTALGKDMSARVKDVSVDKIGAAATRIQSAMSKVNAAKAKLTSYKQSLELAAKKAEQDKAKEHLAEIQAEIKKVAAAIQTIATLSLQFTKAHAAALTAVAPAATGPLAAAEKGKEGYDAAGKVMGGADPLEKVLEWTLYKGDLDSAKAKIASLGADVSILTAGITRLDGNALSETLKGCEDDFKAAKQESDHNNREFFLAMNQVGRDWDQRNMTDKEKSDPNNKGAVPDTHDANSMEGILSMYAAVQVRGNARKAFRDHTKGNTVLTNGPGTVAMGLKSPIMFDVGDGHIAQGDIDSKGYQQRMPDDAVLAEARAARSTAQNIYNAMMQLPTLDAAEAANEAAWVAMVSSASQNKLK
jgi:hypothetical protein